MSRATNAKGGRAMKLAISDKRLGDLLCSGMEGGINYWACLVKFTKPKKDFTPWDALPRAYLDGFSIPAKLTGTVYRHVDYPLFGGSVTVELTEGDHEGQTTFTLTRRKLLKGLETMATKYPMHFGRFIAENEDAETGDLLIQCALFGEAVFG